MSCEEEIKYGEKKVQGFQSIEFSDVSFGYTSGRMILKDISFKIQKGEKIALVGDNGVGKTTMIQLLLGLYIPLKGEVKVNGHTLDTYCYDEINKFFGVLPQHIHIYSVSIICNMLRGLPKGKKDYDRCWETLSLCGLKEKIRCLPKGLDTIMTREFDDDGEIFSIGENQKLGIAGMLAQDKEVYIFDEPTSSLDPISEYKIVDNLFHILEDKTVIFISHRLSFAAKADRIFVIKDGRIEESGSHNNLLMQNGLYAEMWKKQASSYL